MPFYYTSKNSKVSYKREGKKKELTDETVGSISRLTMYFGDKALVVVYMENHMVLKLQQQ